MDSVDRCYVFVRQIIQKLMVMLYLTLANGCYVTRQAWHHAGLLSQRREIQDVIEDRVTPEFTKGQLKRVVKILEFAAIQGLQVENSYGHYIETGSPVVSYLVQAALTDQLKFKTWWFPIVGEVPYLGFYEKSERDELANELEREGFDIRRGAAGAYSSLGWFEDPIFSSMIQRSHTSLAHLLFHELTHRTFWVQNAAEFNENLAEYIAHLLTIKYLNATSNALEIPKYQARLRDKERLRRWLVNLRAELETIYQTKRPKSETLKLKANTISKYLYGFRRPTFEDVDLVSGETWNNATILAAVLYAPDRERYEKAHRCFDRELRFIGRFLEELDQKINIYESPYKALDSFCSSQK